ncbi:MAG: 6-phosphofructokinase [Ruminococcaceae bacterium]|nr:6-phosphofructokinase [Oscillospiraceae bacterium]
MFTKKKPTIAVLTSGGDAPGMNAAIRAVVRSAIAREMKIFGVYHGYNGLIDGKFEEMQLRSVSDIMQKGGTMLYTARCPEFCTQEGIDKAVKMCYRYGIDGVVTIGGDGTFRGAGELSAAGVPCVGIPCTIDNDIACSEYTIGYDTAMNTAMRMVDNIRDTVQSHDRCNIVEVMGRHAGWLALNTGISCGASVVLVPEIEYDFDRDIHSKITSTFGTGKHHFIIVAAEGVGGLDEIAKQIIDKTGMEVRTTVLGHIQRGGSPTVQDRVYATEMGYRAVELLSEGKGNRVVAIKDGKMVDYDLNEALAMKKPFDYELFEIAHAVSI